MSTDHQPRPTSSPTGRSNQSPPRAWTWRHAVAGTFIAADLLYIAFIISGIAWSGERILYPPQLSQIIAGTLSAGTALSISLIVIARIASRVEDAVVVIGILAARIEDAMRAHSAAAVADGARFDALAKRQDEMDKTLGMIGGELAKLRLLVEQQSRESGRGGAGASRRRRSRNGAPVQRSLDEAELRGYLTGVYDKERGIEP